MAEFTSHQSQHWAAQLAYLGKHSSVQVDATLLAVRSPLSKGVVLADEVGLGKTIEAVLVLAQAWAERPRRVLIIVPASQREQWAPEFDDKFQVPTIVLESASCNGMVKGGKANPSDQEDCVVVCSYHFAANKSDRVAMHLWDLVVIDETDANIPVLGDAERTMGMSAKGVAGNGQAALYADRMGALDAQGVRALVQEVLEGGRRAFKLRRKKYGF